MTRKLLSDDQAAFFASMQENRERLQGFCNKLFEDGDIIRRLQLLENFEQIKFLGIDLNQHYAHTLGTALDGERRRTQRGTPHGWRRIHRPGQRRSWRRQRARGRRRPG